MGGDRLSLQEIIKRRQQADFVGREERLAEFRSNLRLPVADHRRRFVFNVHGAAGVGKTFLTQRLRRVAEQEGAACAYTDESRFDVLETMAALAADFARNDRPLAEFDRRLETYRQRRHELDADPGAPASGFVTRSAVHIGLAAARGVPVLGVAAGSVDANATAEQVDRLRAYLSKKFRSSDDVRLLLSPAEVLTRVFVADLRELASRQPVALFFDTFERTAPFLEGWLLDLLTNRYGELPADLVITIAGQRPLDPNRWSPYRSILADVPLAPFTEAEARELLASRGVRDEQVVQVILTLSGRLPVWLATLADARPDDRTAVEDPSDSAVERFLKWEPDERRRAVALAGALPRRLNEDVLAAVCGDGEDRAELFGWLRGLPFVTESAGHWQYHDVARAPMLRLQRGRSPQRWREQHRRLAAHYRAEREALAMSDGDGWHDDGWQDLRIEETYHSLCADQATGLPAALADAVHALDAGIATARRWAEMLTAAGIDAAADRVREWGERLAATVLDEDADGTAFLTALIDDAALAPDARKKALTLRGHEHREAGRYQPALADFDQAVRLDPQFGRALAGRGETYRLMGRLAEAIADFDHAIQLDPSDEWSIASRGQSYETLGRYEQAIADLNRAIELNPGYAWAIRERGRVYERMGRYDDALADFDRAIPLEPDNPWAFGHRGRAYATLGRYQEALADFDHALRLDPTYDWARAERGDTYRAMRRYDEAIADFDRAIELDPDYAWAIASRGQAYAATGHDDKAIADFDRALELEPRLRWAFAARAEAYRRMGRYDQALADTDRAIELAPVKSWAKYTRGTVLLAQGHPGQAAVAFRAAVEAALQQIAEEPHEPRHSFNLAVYRAALGEWDEARRLLLETLRVGPAGSRVADVLDDLAELARLPGVDRPRVDELVELVRRHRPG